VSAVIALLGGGSEDGLNIATCFFHPASAAFALRRQPL
jgi:hypothetical protein